MNAFRRFLSRLRARRGFSAPIAPDKPFFSIGDIHGCADLLAEALDRIDAMSPGATILCVGDMIDRGEDTSGVLRLLRARAADDPARLICLKGNHEEMCLRFLEAPDVNGEAWFRFGGLQTLASYGVAMPKNTSVEDIRDALATAMGVDTIRWLIDLPAVWMSGNVAVTHAGADPLAPISEQPDHNLIWGHRDFGKRACADGMWIVHGHTVVTEPTASTGRIAIDTGAYATGRLTVAHVRQGGVDFHEVRRSEINVGK